MDRRTILVAGLLLLIAADLVLALSETMVGVAAGVALWGLHMGLIQGLLATLVADTAPAELRGTAYGMFNLVTGLALLAASVVAGTLWDVIGPEGTFFAGAVFAALAVVGLLPLSRGRDGPAGPRLRLVLGSASEVAQSEVSTAETELSVCTGESRQAFFTCASGQEMRILLIEDEALLGEAVAAHLNKLHAVDWLQSLEEAAGAMQAVSYDLLLLDLNLPDGRGLDLLRSLRKNGESVPVIIITARDQIRDRIEGLNAGADDYVLKPFDLDELTARIHSVQRRAAALPSPRFKIGTLEIDQPARTVWRDQEEIHLTAREWALLECFVRRLGAIVPKAKLEEALYEFGSEIESNAVEVYVSRLRKKLGSSVIRTIRGIGYRMDA